MSKVVEFLQANPVQYLATVGRDNKAKVRPFMFLFEQDSDYSGSPAHPGRSSAQPDRASAHLIRSAVQLMPVADQHTC